MEKNADLLTQTAVREHNAKFLVFESKEEKAKSKAKREKEMKDAWDKKKGEAR